MKDGPKDMRKEEVITTSSGLAWLNAAPQLIGLQTTVLSTDLDCGKGKSGSFSMVEMMKQRSTALFTG